MLINKQKDNTLKEGTSTGSKENKVKRYRGIENTLQKIFELLV